MMGILKHRIFAFLRWTERYTKTDMVYLAHGGFWLGLSQAIASLGAFALTIVLANLLDPEVFGEYRFLISGFLILIIFALPGMQTALMESTPRGFKRNIVVSFRESMRFGFIGSVISLLIALYYFVQGNVSLSLGFIVITLALPLFSSSEMHLPFLKSLKKFRSITIYTFVTRAILLIASVIVAFLYPQYAWVILAAFLFGQIIPNVIFHKKTVAKHVSNGDTADPTLPLYAKHLTAMTALGLLAAQLDKILIWNMVGAEELAIFFIAYAIPHEIQRFLQIVPTLAFPKFANTNPEVIRKTLMPKLLKYLVTIAGFVLLYIFLAPYIFQLLFPQYMESVAYSQVLMFTVLAAAFYPIRTFFVTVKATKTLYFLSLFLPTVRIVAAIALIALFGIWGGVYALIIEAIVRTYLSLRLFLRTNVLVRDH